MKPYIIKKLQVAFLSTFIIFFQTNIAMANNENNDVEEFILDPVVITATRIKQTVADIPASVSIITEKDIKNKNATSVQEIIKNEAGIMYNDVSDSIQLRGRDSDNIMVLVDGVPSFAPFNSNANFDAIAVDNIDRIEILRGPASSLYGGNAVAGVINIITKDIEKDSISIRLSGGKNNTWIKNISFNKKISDKFSFGGGWEGKNSDGYVQRYARIASSNDTPSGNITGTGVIEMPDGKGGSQYIVGERGRRGYDKDNIWLKMNYKFDEKRKLTYSFSHYKYKGETTGAKSYIKDADGNPIFSGSVELPNGQWVNFKESNFLDYLNRKKVLTHSLQYSDNANNIAVNLGLSDVKDAGYNSSAGYFYEGGSLAEYPGKTYNMDFQKVWDKDDKHKVVAGFTVRQDELDYKNWKLSDWKDKNSKTTLNYDSGGKNRSVAIFLQDEYTFTNKWKLYTGLRYDNYRMSDGYSNLYNATTPGSIKYPSHTYHEISPKLAFEYKPEESSSLYASYGHSFRPPDLYHLYRVSKYSNYDYVGNPYLKPETSDTFEIGYKKSFSNKTDFGISVFYSKTKDAIVAVEYAPGTFPIYLDPSRKVKAYTNVEEEERRGIELTLKHRFNKRLKGYLNYTWQHGKYVGGESADKAFSEIPKHLFNIGLSYEYEKWLVAIDGRFVSQRNKSGTPTGIYYLSNDPYFTADLRIGYEINKNMKMAFSVNNILDREYYQDYIAPGRTYAIEMRMDF